MITDENEYLIRNYETELIYFYGDNKFPFDRVDYKRMNIQIPHEEIIQKEKVIYVQDATYLGQVINNIIEILRLLFLSLFYITGTVSFTRYYTRKVFLEKGRFQ